MPQHGEELIIHHDPLTAYTGPDGSVEPLRCQVKFYEWRRGPDWTFGTRVGTSYLPTLRTTDWNVGTETYWVRAVLDTGHVTRAGSVSVTMATPDGTRARIAGTSIPSRGLARAQIPTSTRMVT